MAILGKDAFTPDKYVKVVKVNVPELGGEVCLCVMTARQKDNYDLSINDGKRQNLENICARLVVRCLCDEQGVHLFGDNIAEGERVLGDMPYPVIERLFEKCREINGMAESSVEDAAKN